MKIFAKSSAPLMPSSPKSLMRRKSLFSGTKLVPRAHKIFGSTPLSRDRRDWRKSVRPVPKARRTLSPLSTCECRLAGTELKPSPVSGRNFPIFRSSSAPPTQIIHGTRSRSRSAATPIRCLYSRNLSITSRCCRWRTLSRKNGSSPRWRENRWRNWMRS